MRDTRDLPGADGMAALAPPREVLGGAMVLVALKISTIPGSMERCKPVRGGLTLMRQHHRMLPWKAEGGWTHAGWQPRTGPGLWTVQTEDRDGGAHRGSVPGGALVSYRLPSGRGGPALSSNAATRGAQRSEARGGDYHLATVPRRGA